MSLPVLFRTTSLRPTLRRRPTWNLSTEVDHLVENLLRGAGSNREAPAYTPPVDLIETPSEICVSAELPGLGAEDFHIEFEDGVLRVHGEKASPLHEEEKVGWHRSERSYGRFERAIRIPVEVDAEAAKAHYRDGVLSIALPKAASAQVREIPVEAATPESS